MIRLTELLDAVKEQRLTKTELEAYSDELTTLSGKMEIETAELEKEEARFMIEKRGESDIATQRAWNVTPSGQRFIELKHYIRAVNKLLSSLKHRIFNTY